MVKILIILLLNLTLSELAFAEPIVIGLLTELSGVAANTGSACQSGFELARRFKSPSDRVQGNQVNFVYGDHKSDPMTGIAEFNRMAEIEGAWAIVSNRSPVVMAISPLAAKHNIPILAITGHPLLRTQNRNAYEFWPLVEDEAETLSTFLASRNLQSLAILSTIDEWTLGLRSAVRSSFEKRGGHVIYDREIEKDNVDLRSFEPALKAAAPDAIFVNLRPGQTGLAVRRIRTAGIEGQLLGNVYLSQAQEIEVAGKSTVEGGVVALLNFERPRFLAQARAMGIEPGAVVYSCYAALSALLEALATMGNPPDHLRLSEALSRMTGVQLPDETVPFRERAARYELRPGILRNGRPVIDEGRRTNN